MEVRTVVMWTMFVTDGKRTEMKCKWDLMTQHQGRVSTQLIAGGQPRGQSHIMCMAGGPNAKNPP